MTGAAATNEILPDPRDRASTASEPKLEPANAIESVIFWAVASTYPIWLVGGLYLVGSALGWLAGLLLLARILRSGRSPIPGTVWLWIVGIVAIAGTLFASHADFHQSTGTLIKSLVSWARTWALLPLYLLVGCLPIRPQILYRAAGVVSAWTLALMPFLWGLKAIHFREIWYTSPLRVLGGPNAISFFQIGVYSAEDHGAGELRWKLFAPWSPALGLMGVFFFMFALQDKGKWRWIGIVGSLLMIGMSGSRMSLVSLPAVLIATWCLHNIRRPMVLVGAGIASALGGLGADWAIAKFTSFYRAFKAARAGSSQVRSDLQKIAWFRFPEAPIWGHGMVDSGPITVAYMPIGSHHTWFGLLFVHGVVGLVALLVPMVVTTLDLAWRSLSDPLAMTGLRLMLTLWLFSLGENIESIAYFYWPALVGIGMALCQRSQVSSSAIGRA
ncbi:MAG: O-antigen ligase family protein [Cyanobacteria bacterium J06639_1]